ncbi:MAG: tRNA (adenine-N1)-methyltransferase [Caldisphaeraceae archaeon]|nr:tRNA (adenine-N1)-methyltransferase [Caldisphaeraceae archaeon]
MSEKDLRKRVLLVVEGSKGKRKIYYFKVSPKSSYSTFAGNISGDELIRLDYGSKIVLERGIAYIIEPSLYDIIMHELRRNSQVIYPKDSGYITSIAGIKEGMRVLEAGIGSGFLTISIANLVCPSGKVYTYDIRDDMIEVAKRNLRKVGVNNCVEIKKGDIREGVNESNLDAAFLDMGDPWNALGSIYNALKNASPIVIFVPTVNQVEKLINHLNKDLFIIQEIVEILKREWEVRGDALRPSTRMIAHTGFIILIRKLKSSKAIFQ